MKHSAWTALAVIAAAWAAPGMALADTEVDRLRAEFEAQLQTLRQTYEARLQDMEARLAGLARTQITEAAKPSQASQSLQSLQTTVLAADPPAASAFNPEISLVLQGAYVRQKDIAERQVSGFMPARHEHGGGERGFTLGHSELVFSANIDPYWRGHMNFAVADEAVEVEEAWFQSLGLGSGLTLKGGRFLSGIGYANGQHPHAWDFADASLMQRVLFGEHLRQDGVQLKWLAPSEAYWEFGIEAGRGQSFPGSAAGGNRNGAGAWAVFAHTGGDIGASHSWSAGLSYLAARPRVREAHLADFADVETQTTFDGTSKTWLADFVWKWAPDGNTRERHFKLQGEIFHRNERGELACADNSAEGGLCVGGVTDAYRVRQSGGYLQGVYQFARGWRTGYRYDRLDAGSVNFGALPFAGTDDRPVRHSLMVDYATSEFSRFRVQLARDSSMAGVVDHQATLQYIHSIGAHGAHRF